MGELPAWRAALLVGLGGSLGALSRYYVGLGVGRWLGKEWPFGTLVANLLGCLALGLLTGLDSARGIDAHVRAFAMIGFLGAFTTFSTFSYEVVRLLRESPSSIPGLTYLGVSVGLGLGLAFVGFRLTAGLQG